MTVTRRRVLRGGLVAGVLALLGCAPHPRDRPVEGETRSTHRYGDATAQVAELRLPVGAPHGVVVLVHGGYWRQGYDRTLEDAVAADLVEAGWAVWNLDYRAVGDGGGWPATFEDVAAGTDALAAVAQAQGVALDTVVAVGHSAGGTLALWLAARPRLPAGAPGGRPAVRVTAVASQAGVDDLAAGSRDRLGGGAVDSLMGGGPDDVPDRYAMADPAALLPLGVPLLVVTGGADDLVPESQSRTFATAARAAGDDVRLEVVAGEDHFAQLNPTTGSWHVLRSWLAELQRS